MESEIVVIGGSAGALDVILGCLKMLSSDYRLPIVVCQHVHVSDEGGAARFINENVSIEVIEANDKMDIEPGRVYLAPAGYHLLVEPTRTLALCVGPLVNWSRPSIDVLFETVAHAYENRVLGILLSGASTDGAKGMMAIKDMGGATVAQSIRTAEVKLMPQAAIESGCVDLELTPEDIEKLILQLNHSSLAETVPPRRTIDA